MKTNFFEQVAGLKIDGNLLLNINSDKNGLLTVSAMLSKAGTIPPMVFTALAYELDEAFFDKLTEPVKQTKGLITNLENYKKELDKAKKQPAKDGKATTTTATATTNDDDDDDDDNGNTGDLFSQQPDDSQLKAEKKQYVGDQLLKAKELAKQMKYVEALAALPDPAEYSEQAELIAAKRAEIQKGKEVYDQLQQQFND
jgi:PRTRC genetic system protein E